MSISEGSPDLKGQFSVCTILVVDDDPAMRSLLVDELSDGECRVVEAHDGYDALSQLETLSPDIVITDLKMPGGGYDYLRCLKTGFSSSQIIVMTAFADSQTKMKALELGVNAYFDKPVRVIDLKAAICQVCPGAKSQKCQNKIE